MNAKQQKLAERAMAQDYWLQVMNWKERYEVMQQVPYQKSIAKRHAACMDYLFENRRDAVMAHAKQLNEILNAS